MLFFTSKEFENTNCYFLTVPDELVKEFSLELLIKFVEYITNSDVYLTASNLENIIIHNDTCELFGPSLCFLEKLVSDNSFIESLFVIKNPIPNCYPKTICIEDKDFGDKYKWKKSSIEKLNPNFYLFPVNLWLHCLTEEAKLNIKNNAIEVKEITESSDPFRKDVYQSIRHNILTKGYQLLIKELNL